jgi:copper chaperone NosL
MNTLSRFLLAFASALLLAVLVTPIWRIHLIAPQYPEGLGMEIRANTVRGVGEHDLDNINELNHYIGMKTIDAGAIKELRVIPAVIVTLAVLGFAVALLGRRSLAWGWLGLFVVAGAAGFYDFWKWSYDYGHHLDMENAIIKVPGMTYQPPLIGTKQLLNFTAASWPAIGGILVFVAYLVALAALLLSRRRTAPAVVA